MIIVFQSTHPRGVRPLFCYLYIAFHVFQSTHPRGVRLKLDRVATVVAQFQSTHPRGVRLYQKKAVILHIGFNPRTHEGCDLDVAQDVHRFAVSIHAPTRGATQEFDEIYELWMFQSTHPRGVRLCKLNIINPRLKVSIHAPTRGATDLT